MLVWASSKQTKIIGEYFFSGKPKNYNVSFNLLDGEEQEEFRNQDTDEDNEMVDKIKESFMKSIHYLYIIQIQPWWLGGRVVD